MIQFVIIRTYQTRRRNKNRRIKNSYNKIMPIILKFIKLIYEKSILNNYKIYRF